MATNSDPTPGEVDRLRPRILFAATLLIATGCGQPQVEPENRELLLRLVTAASTRDPDLLESAADEVEEHRARGELSESEAAAFDAIIAAGRSGDWDRAERRAFALREGQRPTEADLERVRARTLPPTRPLEPSAPRG